ncbi:MAG: hypothetical protein V4719_20225 [Planctomycetota bacterium]
MNSRVLISFALLLVTSGCGSSSPIAPVGGVVLLDGKPLNEATVRFIPVSKDGSSSIGETDSGGRFNLSYTRNQKGAWVGKHKVRVNTSKVVSDPSGKETHLVERVPDRYNQKTTLEYEVKSGHNDFELSLKSGGPISTTTNPSAAPRRNLNNGCE